MTFVIYSADNLYAGAHGMYNYEIADCKTIDDAIEIGYENSLILMDSYSAIYNALEEYVQEEINSFEVDSCDYTEDDIDRIRNEIYEDNINFNIWKIKDKIVEKYTIE